MSAFAGTGALIGVILRRDRWLLGPWILLLALYPIVEVANATPALVELARNPGFLMLYGPLHGTSTGALATWSSSDLLWAYGLVSLLVVIRHTRAEEETGRRELLGATVVGRHAPLTAALAVTLAANLAVGLVTALGAMAQDLPAVGSIALGLKLAAVGWIFAAVGAVAAQLTESAAAARGIAGAALGAAFLLRAAGDATNTGAASWLSWLSPLAWANQLRPFAGERWWMLAVVVGAVLVLTGAAAVLSVRRDVGAGMMRPGLGPPAAPSALRGPLGLAWRLHWGPLVGWAAGFAVIGGVFGGAAKGAGDVFRESRQFEDLFERLGGQADASDVFLAGILSILGLAAAAYAVQAGLRLRAEEVSLRAEPVLATPVARLRWAASHLVFALLGPAVALAAAGLGGGLVYGLSVSEVGRELPRVLAGALAQLPGAWVLAGITIALFGLVPRLAAGAWAAWVAALVIWTFSAFGQPNQALLDVSPFTHIPKLPGGHATTTPLLWLATTAAALVGVGLAAFGHRDVGRS
ncbi:MAG: ABC transporter permease [Acidimicrobiales bacterium]